jgi:hypothetical protein
VDDAGPADAVHLAADAAELGAIGFGEAHGSRLPADAEHFQEGGEVELVLDVEEQEDRAVVGRLDGVVRGRAGAGDDIGR